MGLAVSSQEEQSKDPRVETVTLILS